MMVFFLMFLLSKMAILDIHVSFGWLTWGVIFGDFGGGFYQGSTSHWLQNGIEVANRYQTPFTLW